MTSKAPGAFGLKRVPAPPPPPEPKLCVACKGFRAECVVPVGEASAPMCWLCAHHVVDHECSPGDAATAECECMPHQIYPGREPPTVEELIEERLRFVPPRTLLDGMTLAQRRLVLRPEPMRTQKPYERHGTSYTGPVKGLEAVKVWADEPRAARTTVRSRVCHCGVCGELGHYTKTCPTVRRGRS